jgi:DNA-directed RNA polymerase subunit RPC12/RpoP
MIVGTAHIDYFAITCCACGAETQNEYLGWDPVMPQFAVSCPNCGALGIYKMRDDAWAGLPRKPASEE